MKTPIFSAFLIGVAFAASARAQQLPNNEPVADVMAYTEDGEPFHFREEMKGKYSVVVFGCLT